MEQSPCPAPKESAGAAGAAPLSGGDLCPGAFLLPEMFLEGAAGAGLEAEGGTGGAGLENPGPEGLEGRRSSEGAPGVVMGLSPARGGERRGHERGHGDPQRGHNHVRGVDTGTPQRGHGDLSEGTKP